MQKQLTPLQLPKNHPTQMNFSCFNNKHEQNILIQIKTTSLVVRFVTPPDVQTYNKNIFP